MDQATLIQTLIDILASAESLYDVRRSLIQVIRDLERTPLPMVNGQTPRRIRAMKVLRDTLRQHNHDCFYSLFDCKNIVDAILHAAYPSLQEHTS